MDLKITVLMSVYNDEKYLKSSIESILNQSFREFEFLIFDDASTDRSREILENYARQDARIKLVLNDVNMGLSANLARGVRISQGSYIARMDADDIAFNNRIELQYSYITTNNIDILGSYVIDIDEYNEEKGLRKVPIKHSNISRLIWSCPMIHPTVVFNKKAVIKAGSYDESLRRRQDYELWFRCIKTGLKFENIPTPLLYYRHTNEYFGKNDYKVQLQQLNMGIKGSMLTRSAPIAYVGVCIAFFKGILPYKIRRPVNNFLKKFDPRSK